MLTKIQVCSEIYTMIIRPIPETWIEIQVYTLYLNTHSALHPRTLPDIFDTGVEVVHMCATLFIAHQTQ
jgi:hypothetical protein